MRGLTKHSTGDVGILNFFAPWSLKVSIWIRGWEKQVWAICTEVCGLNINNLVVYGLDWGNEH